MGNNISTRIRELRNNYDLTQEELASKLGLKGKSSIANYESGKITPSDEIKLKMCEIFNCSMDYLVGKSNLKNADDFFRKMDTIFRNIYYDNYFKQLLDLGISNEDVKTILSIYFTTPKHSYLINNQNTISIEQSDILNNVLINYSPSIYNKTLSIIKKFLASKKTVLTEILNMEIEKSKKTNQSQFYMCPVYGQISAGQPNWAEECIEGRIPIDPNLMNIVNPEEHFFLRVNGESMNNVVKNGAYALIHKQDIVEDGEIAVVLVNGYDATLKKFTRQGDLIILEPDSNDNSFKTQAYDKNTSIKILGKYIGKMEFN